MKVESSFDREGELRELGVADDFAELALGFEHPGAAVHRRPISPEDQCLTLRWVVRTVSIIDSHGLVDSRVRRSLPLIPSRITVSVSGMPSRNEPAAPECVRSRSSASRVSCSSARS